VGEGKELREVMVKAYIVHSNDYQWTKAYLFHREAMEISELMTVVSGKLHWVVRTEKDDMLNSLVRFDDKEMVTDIYNITAVGNGFEGDAVIKGRLYKAHHLSPFEPWIVVSSLSPAEDSGNVSGESNHTLSSSWIEPVVLNPAPQAEETSEDEGTLYDPAAIEK
jgi:hypothetical protein